MPNPTLAQRLKAQGRDAYVLNRIKTSEVGLRRFKKKNYEFRKIVAGDFGSILGNTTSIKDDQRDERIKLDDLQNFIVNSFSDDNSNRILQTIKILLMQTAYSSPDAEFEDLAFEEAVVNAGWIKSRLSPAPVGCGAVDEMRLGLLDFLIGGLGFSSQCITEGMPAMRWADSLDMNLDTLAPSLSKMRWMSCTYREPLHVWLSIFGAKPFQKELSGGGIEPLNEMIAVDYYFDTDTTAAGSFYAFKRVGGNIDPTPIYSGENPHFFMISGRRVPLLPYEPLYLLQLPSVTHPIGIVEMLLPSQMKIWKLEGITDLYIERGAPFYQGKKGTLNETALQNFEDGEIGAYFEYTDSPIQRAEGIQIDQNIARQVAYYEQQFTAHSGTNPYTLGAPVDGIQYSSEVAQIAGNAGLAESFVARDHAAWWARSLKKFLAVGAANDDNPCTIQIGDVQLNFDAFNPIKQYLRPLADLVISEDSTRFQPQAARVAQALKDLEVAGQVASLFPNAVPKAFEGYLRARNQRNLAEWMQSGQPGAQSNDAAAASTSE